MITNGSLNDTTFYWGWLSIITKTTLIRPTLDAEVMNVVKLDTHFCVHLLFVLLCVCFLKFLYLKLEMKGLKWILTRAFIANPYLQTIHCNRFAPVKAEYCLTRSTVLLSFVRAITSKPVVYCNALRSDCIYHYIWFVLGPTVRVDPWTDPHHHHHLITPKTRLTIQNPFTAHVGPLIKNNVFLNYSLCQIPWQFWISMGHTLKCFDQHFRKDIGPTLSY